MKTTAIIMILLSIIMSGCTSTITKSYSTEFKVHPVEETVSTPDGQKRVIKQFYEFKAIVTENTTLENGETSSQIVSSPFLGTRLGYGAIVGLNDNSPQANGNAFEVEFDDLGSEYLTTLTVTLKKPHIAPVICSQTFTIVKQPNQRVDLTVKTPVD
jgi:hypothetical protein